MKTGDQVLFYSKGVLGWIISLFTFSKYSHIGTVVEFEDCYFILEAMANGVRLIDFNTSIQGRRYRVLELKNPLLKEYEFKKNVMKLADLDYDFRNFVKAGLKLKVEENADKVICSELSAYILERFHTLEINFSEIVPGDFLKRKELRQLFN
jgi:hypothetical protein